MEDKKLSYKEVLKLPIPERLKILKELDIKDVDREYLVDIETVHIDTSLPHRDRILDYVRQIKNPYCYLYKGVVIRLKFAGTESLEKCLIRCTKLQ